MEWWAAPATSADGREARPDKSSYEIFIAVMTLFSLMTLVPPMLQRGFGVGGQAFEEIATLLIVIDVMFSGLFFVDWVRSLVRAPSRRAYLVGDRPGRSVPFASSNCSARCR